MLACSLQEANASAWHFIKQESTHTPAISSWKVEAGGSEIQGQSQLHRGFEALGLCETVSQKLNAEGFNARRLSR